MSVWLNQKIQTPTTTTSYQHSIYYGQHSTAFNANATLVLFSTMIVEVSTFSALQRQCVLFAFNPHWRVLSLSVLRMNHTSAKTTLSATFKPWILPAFFVTGNICMPIFLNLLHFLHFFTVQWTHAATNTFFQSTPAKRVIPSSLYPCSYVHAWDTFSEHAQPYQVPSVSDYNDLVNLQTYPTLIPCVQYGPLSVDQSQWQDP